MEKKIDHENNQNQTGTALLIWEKITINTNVAGWDKEGHYNDKKINAFEDFSTSFSIMDRKLDWRPTRKWETLTTLQSN